VPALIRALIAIHATVIYGLIAVLGLGAALAWAQAPAPAKAAEAPKLEEIDALRIGKLAAERAALMEAYQRVQLEQVERQRLFTEKSAALTTAIAGAAAKAGLDLKDGWRPDPDREVWIK
jgi:hypothetical protein